MKLLLQFVLLAVAAWEAAAQQATPGAEVTHYMGTEASGETSVLIPDALVAGQAIGASLTGIKSKVDCSAECRKALPAGSCRWFSHCDDQVSPLLFLIIMLHSVVDSRSGASPPPVQHLSRVSCPLPPPSAFPPAPPGWLLGRKRDAAARAPGVPAADLKLLRASYSGGQRADGDHVRCAVLGADTGGHSHAALALPTMSCHVPSRQRCPHATCSLQGSRCTMCPCSSAASPPSQRKALVSATWSARKACSQAPAPCAPHWLRPACASAHQSAAPFWCSQMVSRTGRSAAVSKSTALCHHTLAATTAAPA